jgi:hypothetical protein
MGLDKDKLKRLEDKLKYLYKMELQQKKFVVSTLRRSPDSECKSQLVAMRASGRAGIM